MRAAVCAGLEWCGIVLDPQANTKAKGEATFHAVGSKTQLWTMPTNEELVVARQAAALLRTEK
jgi:acetate kinase